MEQNIQQQLCPPRIKDEIMHTGTERGGFGMVKLHDLMIASRLKRYMTLKTNTYTPLVSYKRDWGQGSI
jgi:hypothetical protein